MNRSVCTSVCAYIHVHVCMVLYVSVYMCIHICVYACTGCGKCGFIVVCKTEFNFVLLFIIIQVIRP